MKPMYREDIIRKFLKEKNVTHLDCIVAMVDFFVLMQSITGQTAEERATFSQACNSISEFCKETGCSYNQNGAQLLLDILDYAFKSATIDDVIEAIAHAENLRQAQTKEENT